MSVEYLRSLCCQLMPQGKCADSDTTESARLGARAPGWVWSSAHCKSKHSAKKTETTSKQKISPVPRWKWEHSAAGFFSQSLKSGVLRKV